MGAATTAMTTAIVDSIVDKMPAWVKGVDSHLSAQELSELALPLMLTMVFLPLVVRFFLRSVAALVLKRRNRRRRTGAPAGGGERLLLDWPPAEASPEEPIGVSVSVLGQEFQLGELSMELPPREPPRAAEEPGEGAQGCAGRALKLGGLSPRTAARPIATRQKPGRGARGGRLRSR